MHGARVFAARVEHHSFATCGDCVATATAANGRSKGGGVVGCAGVAAGAGARPVPVTRPGTLEAARGSRRSFALALVWFCLRWTFSTVSNRARTAALLQLMQLPCCCGPRSPFNLTPRCHIYLFDCPTAAFIRFLLPQNCHSAGDLW
jgi:hypothetical protein